MIVTLVFVFTNTKAHNPNTCSVIFRPINKVWVAQFTISQQGANAALHQFYSDTNFAKLSPEDFKKLYVQYLKAHSHLKVDGLVVPFSSAGIKLGNHQTNINFLLPDFPLDFKEVQLELSVFEENKDHHSVVRFKDGDKLFRKVLQQNNQFKLQFRNTETGFRAESSSPIFSPLVLSISAVLFLIFGIFILRLRKRKSN